MTISKHLKCVVQNYACIVLAKLRGICNYEIRNTINRLCSRLGTSFISCYVNQTLASINRHRGNWTKCIHFMGKKHYILD